MDWLVLLPPSLALTLLLLVPGWALLTMLGRCGLGTLTAAPAVSLGVVAGAALMVEATGWSWGYLPIGVAALVIGALAYGVSRWGGTTLTPAGGVLHPSQRWRNPAAWVGVLVIVGSLLLWLRHLTNVLPEPTAFSQTFDNVFHLNVIRYISDTGDPGPWLPRNLDPALGSTILYPTAWHQLAALALPFAGGSVPVASNALLFVVCAVVWPLSALELCLALGVRTPAALLSAGVLAGSFSSYPFLMLDWGVLYPNLLAYSVIPAALPLLAALLRAGPDTRQPLAPLILIAGLAALGIAVAHPNGALLLLAMAVPALLGGAHTTLRLARIGNITWLRAVLWWCLAAGLLAGFVRLWLFARPTNRPWPPLHDLTTAFQQALYGNPILGPVGPIPALLAATGLALLTLVGRQGWFLGATAVGLTLWVVGSGAPDGPVRELLTGAWYSDSYRLAPILALLSVPAAAYAVDRAVRWVHPTPIPRRAQTDRAAMAPTTRLRRRLLATTTIIPALLVVSSQWSPSIHHAVTHAHTAYDFADFECAEGDVTCLLTPDEFQMLRAVENLTPPDAVLLADPETGASLAYAFTGRRVLRPYIGATVTDAEQLLLEHLRAGPEQPGVCPAIQSTGITHVLDFGRQNVHSRWVETPGLDHLDESPAVRLVERHGAAALYEVVACR